MKHTKIVCIVEWFVLLLIFGPISFLYYGIFRDREQTGISVILPFFLGLAISLFIFVMISDSFAKEVSKKAAELKSRDESFMTDKEIEDLARSQVSLNNRERKNKLLLYPLIPAIACVIILFIFGSRYLLFCFALEAGVCVAQSLVMGIIKN